jgi:sporulation protein YlmC with PRC-barrel domain
MAHCFAEGICAMQSGSRMTIIIAIALLISPAVLAQTVQPPPPSTNAPSAKWITEEAAGQWRASKLIGLNVYNKENEKIGAITELIVDESGTLEAVVVGAGGLLGLGEHDVAVPYGKISWVYVPGVQTPANTAPSTATKQNGLPEGAHPEADKAFLDTLRARPFPDHAVLDVTKEQLKAAPTFKFSR